MKNAYLSSVPKSVAEALKAGFYWDFPNDDNTVSDDMSTWSGTLPIWDRAPYKKGSKLLFEAHFVARFKFGRLKPVQEPRKVIELPKPMNSEAQLAS